MQTICDAVQNWPEDAFRFFLEGLPAREGVSSRQRCSKESSAPRGGGRPMMGGGGHCANGGARSPARLGGN